MAATKQLLKDLAKLQRTPPEGIKVEVNGDDMTDIQAWIQGPEMRPMPMLPRETNAAGTPYENGVFKIRLTLSEDFPNSPPKGHFLTKIFHPNVSESGEICVNTLKKDWKKQLGIEHILVTIKCLLIYPNPESALNEEAGKLLLEQYDAYSRHAVLMTSIHAQNKLNIEFPSYDNKGNGNYNNDENNGEAKDSSASPQASEGAIVAVTKTSGPTSKTKQLQKATKKKDKKSNLRRL